MQLYRLLLFLLALPILLCTVLGAYLIILGYRLFLYFFYSKKTSKIYARDYRDFGF